jgi:aminopeptidase 2
MIGDFDYIEAYTSGEFNGERIQCRLYTPVGLADQGHYSLDLAVKVMHLQLTFVHCAI